MPFVTFLRHGESTGNAAFMARGSLAYEDASLKDCGLTENGVAQARAVRLDGRGFDRIYCSPARRCVETLLAAIPGAADLPVIVDWRLLEGRGWAIFNEVRDVSEVAWPAAWNIEAAGDERADLESVDDVTARGRSWWFDTYESSSRALVVTHGLWMSLWFAEICGQDVRFANCEARTVCFESGYDGGCMESGVSSARTGAA
jgi:broad specificity phosphatase PhoE